MPRDRAGTPTREPKSCSPVADKPRQLATARTRTCVKEKGEEERIDLWNGRRKRWVTVGEK